MSNRFPSLKPKHLNESVYYTGLSIPWQIGVTSGTHKRLIIMIIRNRTCSIPGFIALHRGGTSQTYPTNRPAFILTSEAFHHRQINHAPVRHTYLPVSAAL